MPRPDPSPTQLDRDLADLKLLEIAKRYREVLDEAARKGSSMLEVLAAINRALELQTYDVAYVENMLLAERRRRHLPTPTLPTPKRRELIDDIELEPADPAHYDRFCHDTEENSDAAT